jgi:hypothetical protein
VCACVCASRRDRKGGEGREGRGGGCVEGLIGADCGDFCRVKTGFDILTHSDRTMCEPHQNTNQPTTTTESKGRNALDQTRFCLGSLCSVVDTDPYWDAVGDRRAFATVNATKTTGVRDLRNCGSHRKSPTCTHETTNQELRISVQHLRHRRRPRPPTALE